MNRIRWIINLLLIFAVGYGSAVIFTYHIESRNIAPPRMVIVTKWKPQHKENLSVDDHLDRVGSLFPPPAEAVTRAKPSEIDYRVSHIALQLASKKLKATIIGNQQSLAIIKDGDVERTVTEGQSIWGYKVKKISSDKVLLTDKSCNVQLKIGGREPEVNMTEAGRTLRNDNVDLVPTLIRIVISRQEFIKRLDAPDPHNCPMPCELDDETGKPIGLIIKDVPRESLMAAMGFCEGDILLSFNGKKLCSPEDGLTAYQSLKKEALTDFEIERRGKICHLQIEFR